MIIHGIVKQNKIVASLSFAIKEVGRIPTETVEKLRRWMTSKGYAVEGLNIIQMIDLLVGEAIYHYFVYGITLFVEDEEATIAGTTLTLAHGCEYADNTLTLRSE